MKKTRNAESRTHTVSKDCDESNIPSSAARTADVEQQAKSIAPEKHSALFIITIPFVFVNDSLYSRPFFSMIIAASLPGVVLTEPCCVSDLAIVALFICNY